MENISNMDFDKIENLLKIKKLQQLTYTEKEWVKNFMTEDEYASMSYFYDSRVSRKSSELEVKPDIKNKLDKAFKASRKPTFLTKALDTKMPVYQSVAIAFLLFSIGCFVNLFNQKSLVIRDTVQVIRYIPKQEIKVIHEPVYIQSKPKLKPVIFPTNQNEDEEIVSSKAEPPGVESSNPFLAQQQEIALNNVHRVLEENNGSSLGNDTVIRKMLVTVY